MAIWNNIDEKKPEVGKPVMVKTTSGEYGVAVPYELLYGAGYEWGWLYKRRDKRVYALDVIAWRELDNIYE